MIHLQARREAASQTHQCSTAADLTARITPIATIGSASHVASQAASQAAVISCYGSTVVVATTAHRATAAANVQSQAQDAKQAYHE